MNSFRTCPSPPCSYSRICKTQQPTLHNNVQHTIMSSSQENLTATATMATTDTINNTTTEDGKGLKRKCAKACSPILSSKKMKKAPPGPRRFKSAFIFFSSFMHKQIQADTSEESPGNKQKVCFNDVTMIVTQLKVVGHRDLTSFFSLVLLFR